MNNSLPTTPKKGNAVYLSWCQFRKASTCFVRVMNLTPFVKLYIDLFMNNIVILDHQFSSVIFPNSIGFRFSS